MYVDCAAEYKETCELPLMSSFTHALKDMVASAESDEICPNIDISKLGAGKQNKCLHSW